MWTKSDGQLQKIEKKNKSETRKIFKRDVILSEPCFVYPDVSVPDDSDKQKQKKTKSYCNFLLKIVFLGLYSDVGTGCSDRVTR